MPLESCQKYTATLSEILALTPVVQTIADATDVPGVRIEWLNGAWYGDCGFPSADQHAALLAANAYNSLGVGSRATLPSGPVTWDGSAWVDSPSVVRVFDTIEDRDAAYPSPKIGTVVSMRQIVGPGHYMQRYTGTRWGVCAGESVISDTTEVTINADAGMVGVYQIIASYTIPAGLIGDGEIWEWCDAAMQSAGSAGGATTRITSGAALLQTTIAFANAGAALLRGWRRFRRRASGTLKLTGSTSSDSNATGSLNNFDTALDFSQSQTLQWQVSPASSTDVITFYTFSLRRAA